MADDTKALTVAEAPRPARIINQDIVPIFDTARFEQYGRIAAVMARSTVVPDSLRTNDYDVGVANCFQVTEMADRWGMSPFLVAQGSSVVYGKLCFEGKLVASVMEKLLGVRLYHYFQGEYGTDGYRVYVSDVELSREQHLALKPHDQLSHPEGAQIIDGSVAEWKTFEKDGRTTKGNWLKQPDMQLRYRGDRTWGRAFQPGVMLGIIGDDEIEDWRDRRDVPPPPSLSPGFPPETAPQTAAAPETGKRTPARRKAPDAPQAPTTEPETDTGGGEAEYVDPATGQVFGSKAEWEAAQRPTETGPPPGAEPGPDTSGSATAASGASAEASSGPKQPDEALHGGGEGEPAPGENQQSQATSSDSPGPDFVACVEKIEEAPHWDGIKQAARVLAKTEAWVNAADASKQEIRRRMWDRYAELRDSGAQVLPITQDMTLMSLWLQFAAGSPEEIDGLWRSFFRAEAYKGASEADKAGINALMIDTKKRLTP